MNPSEPFSAKAKNAEEQSDGIVVSFGAEWHKPLVEQKFNAVIRKRVPKTVKPAWLYFHINSPVSALCARAKIVAIRELTPAQARAKSADLSLSTAAVTAYLAGDSTIGYYELGEITFAKKDLTAEELSQRMAYHPPQSFFILSKAAKQVIDTLAGFEHAPISKQGRKKS